MKYIAVFCSANNLEDKYKKAAKEFARLLATHGYGLVWGGSDVGLMKLIASEVQAHNRRLIGVSLEHYQHVARKNADEMIVVKELGERKAAMLSRADAITVLVGGIGTLDEITEILELKKQNAHQKPIVILNTENFYDGLKVQLQKMKGDGLINKPLDELIYFADKPEQAIEYINRQLATSHS